MKLLHDSIYRSGVEVVLCVFFLLPAIRVPSSMVNLRILSRSETAHTRGRRDDMLQTSRVLDPFAKPFSTQIEYLRALRAAKLSRLFAKPFLGALEGHVDGISCLATSAKSLVTIVSGSCDGVVKVWDLSNFECQVSVQAHAGFVRGVCVNSNGNLIISCGDDKTVKIWSSDQMPLQKSDQVYTVSRSLLGCDASWQDADSFATCGQDVSIWDVHYQEPLHQFSWGSVTFFLKCSV